MQDIQKEHASSDYVKAQLHDHYIATLDPLGADQFFIEQLPQFNMMKLTGELIATAKRYMPDINTLTDLGPSHAKAIMRDLGFIAASLAAHGIDLSAIPNLESLLLSLSKILNEVPRDTVTTYGVRNSLDQRMRTFTGIPEEHLFIRSVVDTINTLPACLVALDIAQQEDPGRSTFLECLQEANFHLQTMVRSITAVKRQITPEVFSFQLRPFFPPLIVGDKKYLAPGGAQLALLIIDVMTYGSHRLSVDEVYKAYVEDNEQYLPPEYRAYLAQVKTRPSLVKQVCKRCQEICGDVQMAYKLLHSLDSLLALLHTVLKFRFPHKKLARDNMLIRPSNSVGSGGYDATILDVLIQVIEEAIVEINQIRIVLSRSIQ